VASELGVEGFLLLAHLLVSVLLAPSGDGGQAPTEPFAHRPHVDGELPSSAACADVREPEEIEGAGLVPLPLRVSPCVPPKFHQPRLLRVQRQAVFGKPLRQDVHHLFSVLPVLEAQNGIIGESDLVSFPFQSGLHHFLKPHTKRWMKWVE
jgi:hypothetical protein